MTLSLGSLLYPVLMLARSPRLRIQTGHGAHLGSPRDDATKPPSNSIPCHAHRGR